MKLLCNIINLTALVMVLLLGAVSVHAGEPAGDVGIEAAGHHSTDQNFDSHVHLPGDSAIHCGAPLLSPDPLSLAFPLHVAAVVYFARSAASRPGLAIEDMRPPRS